MSHVSPYFVGCRASVPRGRSTTERHHVDLPARLPSVAPGSLARLNLHEPEFFPLHPSTAVTAPSAEQHTRRQTSLFPYSNRATNNTQRSLMHSSSCVHRHVASANPQMARRVPRPNDVAAGTLWSQQVPPRERVLPHKMSGATCGSALAIYSRARSPRPSPFVSSPSATSLSDVVPTPSVA